MTEEEFRAALDRLRAMPEEDRLRWLTVNQEKFNDDQLAFISYDPSITPADIRADVQNLSSDRAVQQTNDTIADQARDQSLANGADRYTADQTAAAAVGAAGGDPADASDDQFAGDDYILPREVAFAIGSDVQTQEQADQILEYIQSEYPQVGSIQQAWDMGLLESPTVRNAMSLLAEPPKEDLAGLGFRGQNGRQVFIPTYLAQAASDQFGLDEGQLVKSVQMAEVYGFETAAGDIAWQPFLALAQANGFKFVNPDAEAKRNGQLLTRQQELRESIAELREVGARAGSGAGEALQDMQAELAQVEARLRAGIDPNRVLTPRQIAQSWNEGMRLYDSETLAFFHSLNPGLASRMNGSEVLSMEDARMSLSLMAKAGLSGDSPEDFAINMGELGFLDPLATKLVQAQAAAAAAGGGGGGSIRMQPDPVAIRQSAKDMYRNLYMEEPTEEQLTALTASITGSIMSAPTDMSVSPEARIRDAVETNPKYQELYGKKPGGMTEEEYQGMHRSAQASMLGNEAAGNVAARAGMRSGKYQTTVGSTLGLEESWDNSTFMGRLARAAQQVTANT